MVGKRQTPLNAEPQNPSIPYQTSGITLSYDGSGNILLNLPEGLSSTDVSGSLIIALNIDNNINVNDASGGIFRFDANSISAGINQISVDTSGNIYLSNSTSLYLGNTLLEGNLPTFAGIQSIALDQYNGHNDLIVCDIINTQIYRINLDTSGYSYTVDASGTSLNSSSEGEDIIYGNYQQIAVGTNNSIYALDDLNGISKIDVSGNVTLVTVIDNPVNYLVSVAIDSSGTLYYADKNANIGYYNEYTDASGIAIASDKFPLPEYELIPLISQIGVNAESHLFIIANNVLYEFVYIISTNTWYNSPSGISIGDSFIPNSALNIPGTLLVSINKLNSVYYLTTVTYHINQLNPLYMYTIPYTTSASTPYSITPKEYKLNSTYFLGKGYYLSIDGSGNIVNDSIYMTPPSFPLNSIVYLSIINYNREQSIEDSIGHTLHINPTLIMYPTLIVLPYLNPTISYKTDTNITLSADYTNSVYLNIPTGLTSTDAEGSLLVSVSLTNAPLTASLVDYFEYINGNMVVDTSGNIYSYSESSLAGTNIYLGNTILEGNLPTFDTIFSIALDQYNGHNDLIVCDIGLNTGLRQIYRINLDTSGYSYTVDASGTSLTSISEGSGLFTMVSVGTDNSIYATDNLYGISKIDVSGNVTLFPISVDFPVNYNISVAVDSSGIVYYMSGNDNICYYNQYTDASGIAITGSSITTGISSLTLDSLLNIYFISESGIYIAQYDGSTWSSPYQLANNQPHGLQNSIRVVNGSVYYLNNSSVFKLNPLYVYTVPYTTSGPSPYSIIPQKVELNSLVYSGIVYSEYDLYNMGIYAESSTAPVFTRDQKVYLNNVVTDDNANILSKSSGPFLNVGDTPELIVNCLLKGTMILTPTGYVKIEILKVGDFVVTHEGKKVKILQSIWYTTPWSENIDQFNIVYKVAKGLHSATSNLYISACHKIRLSSGRMMTAERAKFPKAPKAEICENGSYTLYHVQLEDHKVNHLVANGAVVECWDGIYGKPKSSTKPAILSK